MSDKRDEKKRQTIMRRTYQGFRNLKARADKSNAILDYNLAELRLRVAETIGSTCRHCHTTIDHQNFSFDHAIPTSRDGLHSIQNIQILCLRCNQTKGNLTDEEFTRLRCDTAYLPSRVFTNLYARLRAGGRIIRN